MLSYILSIKGQIGCMAVLLYIAWTYFSVKRSSNSAHRLFSLLLIASIVNIIFDMITVYTINHVHEIPLSLNHFLHIIFMSSMASSHCSHTISRYSFNWLISSSSPSSLIGAVSVCALTDAAVLRRIKMSITKI